MKELSVKEKAKRYDEVIEQLRVMMPNWENLSYNGKTFLQDLAHIIPELKESEDERIRKRIIALVNAHGQGMYKDEMIIWLEKQGETFTKKDVDDAYIEGMAFAKDELEKQGEQKSGDKGEPKFKVGDTIKCKYDDRQFTIKSVDLDKGTYTYTQEGCGNDIDYADEEFELVEQKPDKIEPKFNIGDIVTDGNIIGKIDENENNKYHAWFDYNKDMSPHYADIPDIENWHKWTIQDAKEGDVLDANGAPFIYKKHDKDCVYFCCGVNLAGEFIEADGIATWSSKNKVYPATKEQRDLLFQKMHEAGYEWDEEKKELKKCEDNTSEMVEALRTEYEKGRADAIAEMQNAWSEEDEEILEDVRNNFEFNKGEMTDALIEQYDKFFDKIKSLKPQSKQDWSEEDIVAIDCAVEVLSKDLPSLAASIERLKSLRPQNRWKPTRTQTDSLGAVIKHPDRMTEFTKKELTELLEQLKKLQKTTKQ